MTKKDFFILLIKVFGLYSMVVSLFSILPQTISYLFYDIDINTFVITAFSITIIIGLFVLLISKSEYLVDKLKLSNGFDEERIDINNLNSENVLKLASLLLGGYLFITNLPVILNLLFYTLKFDQEGIDFGISNNFDLVVGILNLVVGYLLVTNYSTVSKFLNR